MGYSACVREAKAPRGDLIICRSAIHPACSGAWPSWRDKRQSLESGGPAISALLSDPLRPRVLPLQHVGVRGEEGEREETGVSTHFTEALQNPPHSAHLPRWLAFLGGGIGQDLRSPHTNHLPACSTAKEHTKTYAACARTRVECSEQAGTKVSQEHAYTVIPRRTFAT